MSIHRASIRDDLVPYFPEDEDVNAALRRLIKEGRTPQDIPIRAFKPAWIQRVNIDVDVVRVFGDDQSVNSALRLWVDEGHATKSRTE